MTRALTCFDKSSVPLAIIHDFEDNSVVMKTFACAEDVFDELWNDSSRFDTVVFDGDDFDRDELCNAAHSYPHITFALNRRLFEDKFVQCQNIVYFDCFDVWLSVNWQIAGSALTQSDRLQEIRDH